MKQASNRSAIAPFLAMEMAREADRIISAGRNIVRFDVGQPYFGAPARALDAVRDSFNANALGYTEGLGLYALRARLSRFYAEKHGVDVLPERIVITTGASGAFLLAFLALFDAGDRVALAAPGYPPYRQILSALGIKPAIVSAEAHEQYQLAPHHLDELSERSPLAGALIASPANPTGAMLSKTGLAALAAACRNHGAALVSDEIYHGLTYDGRASSALEVDDGAIVINSFSKYWAMTGWRVGWTVAPQHLITPLERLAQNLTVAPPTPAQIAALAALECEEECEARRTIYARNRDILLKALPKIGLSPIAPPDGAFYMLLDISQHGGDSRAFCARALEEAGVALTTGLDFDDARGAGWVRLAFARETGEIEEGVARLTRWLG
ncbi:MAG: aminotransferase class I/II-fold pyridoxal phosphate-dependent enzyme [Caulobacterales bacterium]